jgi:hypothetical protein
MTDKVKQLLEALQKGPIRAIGMVVYDVDMSYLYSTTDLKDAIDELHQKQSTLRVGRIDSGGAPTWDLK